MSSASTSQKNTASLPGPAIPAPVFAADPVKEVVDRAAVFNTVVTGEGPGPSWISAGNFRAAGLTFERDLHRLDVDLEMNDFAAAVTCRNHCSERLGRLRTRWMFVPYHHSIMPEGHSPPVEFDPHVSQRFSLLETTIVFGDGHDSLTIFGCGRTFPVFDGRRSLVMVGAIGEILGEREKLSRAEGNITLCGELSREAGFCGNVLIRIVDLNGALRTNEPLPSANTRPLRVRDKAFLAWVGEKGVGPDQENEFSFNPRGEIRGMNIPTELYAVEVGSSVSGPGGLRGTALRRGRVIGRETGFGRGSIPTAPPTGTPLSPYPFEGIANYSLFSAQGWTLGSVTTNVLEGRRFDVSFPPIAPLSGWRFGFFGPVLRGSGCFRHAKGMFYGVSASVFQPPPGRHVVTHFYSAMLLDPEGRFRSE